MLIDTCYPVGNARGKVIRNICGAQAAISVSKGKLLWRTPLSGAFGAGAAAIPLGNDLYFTHGSSVTRKDPSSGTDLWREEFNDGALRGLTGNERRLFVVIKGAGESQPDLIAALDRDTGRTLWKSALPEQATSPITMEGQRLYVTTPGNLIAMDALHGSVVFQAPVPSSLQSQIGLPDILRITNDRIIVAREAGVLAMQKDDGKLLFADHVNNGEGFTYDFATNRLKHAVTSEAPLNQKLQAFATQQKTSMNLIVFGTGQRPPGAQGGHTAMVGNALVAGMTAGASMIEAAWRGKRMGVLHAEVNQTLETHANSLRDKFYVRPGYEQNRGWFLHVVSLETGKHTNIFLSPDNETPVAFAANLPAFSAEGSWIVSKGLGLNPEWAEERKGLLRIRHVITYPSILGFDLSTLTFELGSDKETPVPKSIDLEKKKLNDQLVSAAFKCDLATVREMLDAGADVNAVDEYGQTALMQAAESAKAYNRTDLIELLLKRGANANKRDPSGLTALEHMYLLAAGVEGKKSIFNVKKMIEKAQKESQ